MRKRQFKFWVTSDNDGIMIEERIPHERRDDQRYKYDQYRVFVSWKELEKINKIKN